MAERKKHKQADPETARPANDSVGETLRAARQAKGLEIEDVSQSIHIRTAQLKALEESNIEALPGMTYAVGFVRSYANFLGLNGAEIVHRFKAEHGHNSPANSSLSFPEPIAESRVPDPMMVGVGAFLAVVILVLWTIYSNVHGGGKTADATPPAPVVTSVADSLPSATMPATTTDQSASAIAAATATPAATMPAPDTAATATTQPAATTVAATTTPAASTPVATTSGPTAQPSPTPAAKAVAAASNGADSEDEADDETPKKADAKKADNENSVIKIKNKSRITLKATEASWIQVTDSQQKILYRKVLRPDEQYSVPDQPGLILDTANAGGLRVLVDGKKVAPFGKTGDIMRGIPLDPQELKQR